jgi:hypothetical protein
MTMREEYHDKKEEMEYQESREVMFEKIYDAIWVECYGGKWDDGTKEVLKSMITIIDKALNR